MKTNALVMLKRLETGQGLVSDGAWGTQLQAAGLRAGECPELWNLERRDAVLAVALAYVAAGSQVIGTNSFGASRLKLEMYDLADRTVALNEAAAAISREAAGPDGWVLGSMGPTGRMLLMGDTSEQEIIDTYAEQASALAAGGADIACLETMSAIDEAVLAIRAVRENTSLAVACTFTFDPSSGGDFRTMMGVSPEDMARAVLDAGVDIVGTNCGNGFKAMIEIVRRIRAVAPPRIPVLVHANAGTPTRAEGRDVYPETPSVMAARVPDLVAAGANIIGGCCGTTPEHIVAIAAALKRLSPAVGTESERK